MVESADRVVTMGCGVEEVCPASFVPTEDWVLEDPEGKPIEKVREIRDEIKARVGKLLSEIEEAKE
jgi:arsenate reductase